MQSVYISGPLTTDTSEGEQENVRRALQTASRYYEKGYAVFCPHAQIYWIDREFKPNLKYEDWLAVDLYWLTKCDVVVFLSGWERSRGSTIEHMLACALGKTIIYEKDGRDFLLSR